MKHRPRPGELVVAGAGTVLVVASFLPWFHLPSSVALSGFETRDYTAWTSGFSPIATMPAAIGFALALQLVWSRVSDRPAPAHLLGLAWHQARAVAAVFAILIAVGEVATEHSAGPVALERGVGLWLTVVAALALLAGVVLDRVRETASA